MQLLVSAENLDLTNLYSRLGGDSKDELVGHFRTGDHVIGDDWENSFQYKN